MEVGEGVVGQCVMTKMMMKMRHRGMREVDSRDSSYQSGSCKDGRQQHPRPAEQPDER